MPGILKIFFTASLFLFLILQGAAVKPQLKGTDIYLVDLKVKNNKIALGNPYNITDREGYDNQPSFYPDGSSILYSSIRENNQSDIFKYDLQSGNTLRITNTPESEFSPVVMPDGKYFSTVRVEKDLMQRLWKFPVEGGEPSLVLPDIIPVGYHCWADKDNLALFILGEINSLQTYNMSNGKLDIIIGDIGRSLHKVPNKNSISFVHKIADKRLLVRELNLDTKIITPLIQVLDNNEDIAWTPDGTLLMGYRSKIFKWKPGSDRTWTQIADFSNHGIKEILRLAISPLNNKLAFVSNIGG